MATGHAAKFVGAGGSGDGGRAVGPISDVVLDVVLGVLVYGGAGNRLGGVAFCPAAVVMILSEKTQCSSQKITFDELD